MKAVDTNVLVRIFSDDDVPQSKRAKSFIGTTAWVSHIALVETIWVLGSVYERPKADLVRAVEVILKNEALVLQEPEVVSDALWLYKSHSGVAFSDCMILAVSKKAGHTPLGTFDTKLAKIDGTELI